MPRPPRPARLRARESARRARARASASTPGLRDCSSDLCEKPFDLRVRTEPVDLLTARQLVEPREYLRPAAVRVRPDPVQELQVDSLAAALGHVGPRRTPVGDDALEHAPQADGARQVEEDDRVAGVEPDVERVRVVAVNNPRVARAQLLDLR